MSTQAGATARAANLSLLLLVAINLFNYIDRLILSAVVPEIRNELFAEGDPDSGQKMGLLSTAFLFSYMLLAPVFGWLADHYSRWKIIGLGVILWSLASGLSGVTWPTNLATAYWLLFMTRCMVGVGEGAYGPVAPAMIADLYPVEKRGRVMAWFYLAIPVGGALGYTFGGYIKKVLTWHWAFFLVVPPGILLGILCFLMKDPGRGRHESVSATPKKSAWKQYRDLFRIPSYVYNTVGMTLMTFAIGGLAFWMPAYLEFRQGEKDPEQLAFFGVVTAVAGFAATIAGGLIGDWLKPRFSGSYFLVSGIAMLVGFPMVVGILFCPFPYCWIFIFLAVFCLFFNTGPTNTILANVTHPNVRAGAFALNILIIHLLGDAISPPVIGYVADTERANPNMLWGDLVSPSFVGQLKEHGNMHAGFFLVSIAVLLGGIVWLLGSRHLAKDTELASTRG